MYKCNAKKTTNIKFIKGLYQYRLLLKNTMYDVNFTHVKKNSCRCFECAKPFGGPLVVDMYLQSIGVKIGPPLQRVTTCKRAEIYGNDKAWYGAVLEIEKRRQTKTFINSAYMFVIYIYV